MTEGRATAPRIVLAGIGERERGDVMTPSPILNFVLWAAIVLVFLAILLALLDHRGLI